MCWPVVTFELIGLQVILHFRTITMGFLVEHTSAYDRASLVNGIESCATLEITAA